MLEYNTKREKLVLPEFGRNVQQMVNHCMTIEDRAERNRCAEAIIGIMSNLFSNQRDVEDFNKMLWNQLAIISDFKLDIDYPCEVIRPENLHSKPERVPYKLSPIRFRHYGKMLEKLIKIASEMPEGEEREQLSLLIAHHMKKQLLVSNKDGVDDAKVFSDLAFYTKGAISLDPEKYHLNEFKELVQSQQPVKKNKKRK